MTQLKAVIYIDAENREMATRRCLRHCTEQGYDVTSVVMEVDDTSERWRAALAEIASGRADVLVLAGSKPEVPRLEVAGIDRAPINGSQRRPRPR
jgi:uridine kinase